MASSLLAVDDSIDEFSDFESAQTLEKLESHSFEDSTKITCNVRSEIHSHNFSGENSTADSVDSLKGPDALNQTSDFITYNDISLLLQDTFPYPDNDDVQIEINDLDQHCNSHWLWSKLDDVNHFPQQQWEDSRAFQLMLHSLKIDSRNILQVYVPPIISYLETANCALLTNLLSEPETKYNMSDLEICIPDVLFDWTCSGMTNPLEDELCLLDTTGNDAKNISREEIYAMNNDTNNISREERHTGNKNSVITYTPEKWNKNLKLEFPDLSFMQSKVLSIPFQKILSEHHGIV